MRLPDLEPELLRAFVAVAETGGFTAAAARLALTQSAVSVRVRKLEERLGRRLLERTSRRTALTPEGDLLLGYARRLLALAEEAARQLGAGAMVGTLRLGVADYFVPQHLPGLLAAYADSHPAVTLSVQVATSHRLVAAFEAGELDLALVKLDPGDRRGRRLAIEPLVWAAPEQGAPEAREPLPLVVMPSPCFYRTAALDALVAAGRAWRITVTSGSMLGVQSAIAAGLGVGVLGRAAVGPRMRAVGPGGGLPALPGCEVSVLGKADGLAAPLVAAIVGSFAAPAPA